MFEEGHMKCDTCTCVIVPDNKEAEFLSLGKEIIGAFCSRDCSKLGRKTIVNALELTRVLGDALNTVSG